MKETAASTIKFSLEQLHKTDPASDKVNLAVKTLFNALYVISIVAGILAAMDINVPYGAVGITSILAAAGLQALSCLKAQKEMKGDLIFLLIPLGGMVLLWKWTSNGIALLSNQMLSIFGAAAGEIYLPFVIDPKINEAASIAVVAAAAAVWLSILAVYLQRENHPLISTSIVVLLLIFNGCLPQWESGLWLFVTGFCTGVHWAKSHLAQKKLFWHMTALLLSISMVAGSVFAVGSEPIEDWKRDITTSVRAEIHQWIEKKRYGDDTHRAMPMGDFKQLDSLVFSDEAMLKIKKETTWESLYLRGFVGGTFDGESWRQLDGETLYPCADAFYWLHEDGYFGQNLLAKSAQILDENAAEEKKTFTVENLGADSRVFYTPYETTALTADGENQLNCTVLSEDSFWADGWKGASTYEVETLTNQVKQYPNLIASLIDRLHDESLKAFRHGESHYNQFVYQNYTTLSKKEKKLMNKHLGEAGYDQGSHLAYQEAKKRIVDYLDTYVVYTEVLSDRTPGTHFVEDFLELSRAGYSVHYATTATLMFRYFGIPARYVEGYLITPDAVDAAKDSEEMLITDQAAHAWVEYYQDGIGWIPFEVTPPYRDVMEEAEMSSAGSSGEVSEQNRNVELGMEMIEDNYEGVEPEKEEPEQHVPWRKILGVIGIFLLLLLVLFCIRHFYWRGKRLKQRKKSFQQENLNAAIAALFDYILSLQEALGIERKNGSIYDYSQKIGSEIGAEMEQTYRHIARLYQKAVYSQQLMSEEEKHQVQQYKDALLGELKKKCSLARRAKLKWIKGLY